jgi:hypothetical protein
MTAIATNSSINVKADCILVLEGLLMRDWFPARIVLPSAYVVVMAAAARRSPMNRFIVVIFIVVVEHCDGREVAALTKELT